ncbi:ADP-heptose:LPS heptosyltransferase [Pontibacter ummariensis]|uniref:ADP-heptose:LPS heptosyltransferase n=1 Tax=Pontibacter ummariensis TaxID=1610492 RepID=A0A239KER8_9BACT|nr:glycosyltransferase family 9 protein [Pontibacter ummariensis]PRY06415.1 ADP-heptose:LPS heptosyltransferase [Pontibacter ummariensis]SNT16856.1 ADP-heptose:LPS heptosyltransferase [Pontibacter ummariensis]
MTDAQLPFTPGLLKRLPKSPRKVAVLRASRIGDFVCATPALRALREALPAAEITMITLPILRDLAVRCPYVDRYAAFPGFPGLAEQFFDARQALVFFQEMQEEQFDLAIQLQGSGVYTNPFTLMLGAGATAGYVRQNDGAGRLDAALPIPLEGHEINRVLAMTTFLGAPEQGKHTEFTLWPGDHQEAKALLSEADPPFIGLHPAARDQARRWHLERYAEVATALQERHGGTVVLLGEPAEQQTAESMWQLLDVPALNLVGRTSLPVLGAVLMRLHVLLTNDTGPAHIAYALQTPTVTLFGGADLLRYGALTPGPFRIIAHEVDCRPCTHSTCPIGHPCMESITVSEVLAAAEKVIKRSRHSELL